MHSQVLVAASTHVQLSSHVIEPQFGAGEGGPQIGTVSDQHPLLRQACPEAQAIACCPNSPIQRPGVEAASAVPVSLATICGAGFAALASVMGSGGAGERALGEHATVVDARDNARTKWIDRSISA